MKKRNLLPTQTAPVERDNTASSSQLAEKGLVVPSFSIGFCSPSPFVGDDAE